MLTDIPNQDLHVKLEKQVRIQRGRHDKENPYAMISRKMLRDKNLSPRSKGILCFLLSLPDNWNAHPKQVAQSMGVGKDQIYSALNELISKGYATKKETKGEKGRFGSVVYEFYEDKIEPVKEISTVSGYPDTESPDTENPPIKNIYSKKDIEKNSSSEVPIEQAPIVAVEIFKPSLEEVPKKQKAPPPDFSAEVRELASKIVTALHKANPDWIIPKNLHAIMLQIEEMITKDNRTPKRIFDVFMWAVCDSFWMDKLCKPNPVKYLRQQFGQLSGQMKALPASRKNEVDRRLKDKEGNAVDEYKDLMF